MTDVITSPGGVIPRRMPRVGPVAGCLGTQLGTPSLIGCDPGVRVNERSTTGVGYRWSLSIGHRTSRYRTAASLLGIDFRTV